MILFFFNFKRRPRELTRHNGALMAPREIIPAAVTGRKAVRVPLGAGQGLGGAGSAAQQQRVGFITSDDITC